MNRLNCLETSVCKILKAGAIPQHIGFIMDGNRRFARKQKLESIHAGHVQGVKSLRKCLLLCKELSVNTISLFCFSIENFNRSQNEVDGLMKLCVQSFDEMSEMSQLFLAQQIKVNIIGNLSLLREDVRQIFKRVTEQTKSMTKMQINLCFAYDGIFQIEQAISKMQENSYKQFFSNLGISKHLDMLVRTGNDCRLSNFMLAQCTYTHICILKESWPEINLFSFIRIMMEYNYHFREITKNRDEFQKTIRGADTNSEQQSFLKND